MQLKLFSKNVAKSLHTATRKRPIKTLKPVANSDDWNLWSQQSNPEMEMALLFLDIRDFTPLTESYRAFDVMHIIKKLFSGFHNIVQNHHGRIIETSGDGFYAAFGFNTNLKDAMNDAVNAGLAILKNMEVLNNTSIEPNLNRRIEVGIGVHAGNVAVGNIQLNGNSNLIVMGYPVNVASRIQAVTRSLNNNFIVSSVVFNHLITPPLSITVSENLKGVSDSIQLHLIGKPYDKMVA